APAGCPLVRDPSFRLRPPPLDGKQTIVSVGDPVCVVSPSTLARWRQRQNFRDHSFGQRSTTTFSCVKNSIASRPCACRSPKKLSRAPLNGKNAIGAATPTLTPTLPTSASYRNLRAEAPLVVKMLAWLP